MENASKALLMAGGVLLAITIIALLIFVSISMSEMAGAQDKKNLEQQIQDFNESYLAYNKTRLYGIDIITVVNKAINHNKTIGAKETDPYYINIKIIPKQTFKTTVEKIDNTKVNASKEPVDNITNDIKNILGNPSNSYGAYLSAGSTYDLGTWQNNGQTFIMNNNFLDFFLGDTIDKTAKYGNITYIMSSALTNFKKAVFKCESDRIEYSDDGRIKSMTFTQIKE